MGTLVRRTLDADPERDRRRRAVLYVHGWNDYFFHTHVAEFFETHGFTLYAVDLRRCGRSHRPGQYANYIEDLGAYAEEFDLAHAVMAERHSSISVMAHSTGGLSACLWANRSEPGRLDSIVLNSPWLDLWGPPALAAFLSPLMGGLSRRRPTSIVRLPDTGGVYVKALHRSERGEWDFDLELKSATRVPVRVAWLRAVLRGHAEVAKGLDIDCPVFMACSSASSVLNRGSEDDAFVTDIVLDVDKIVARAAKLGPLVTLVRIKDGVHDLTLSARPARERLFRELGRWLDAYVARDAADDLRDD